MGNIVKKDMEDFNTLKFNELYEKNIQNKSEQEKEEYLRAQKQNLYQKKYNEKIDLYGRLKILSEQSYKKEMAFIKLITNNSQDKLYNSDATYLTESQENLLKNIFFGENNKSLEQQSKQSAGEEIGGRDLLLMCLTDPTFNKIIKRMNDEYFFGIALLQFETIFENNKSEIDKLISDELKSKYKKVKIDKIFNELLKNIIIKMKILTKEQEKIVISYIDQIVIGKEVESELYKLIQNFNEQERNKIINWYNTLEQEYNNDISSTVYKSIKEAIELGTTYINEKRVAKYKAPIQFTGDDRNKQEQIKKILEYSLNGYISVIKGSIAEILTAVMLNKYFSSIKSLNEIRAYITGDNPVDNSSNFFDRTGISNLQAKNTLNQSAHSDITVFHKNETGNLDKYGIQVKFYNTKYFNLYSSSNFVIDGSNNLYRYIGPAALEAFYMFTGYQFLEESKREHFNYREEIEYVSRKYKEFFQDRVQFFMRFEDLMASELLQDTQNNFFVINFEVIPTSIIFNNIIQNIKSKKTKDLFNFTNMRQQLKSKNKNILTDITNTLKNKKVQFKGISLNLNKLVK